MAALTIHILKTVQTKKRAISTNLILLKVMHGLHFQQYFSSLASFAFYGAYRHTALILLKVTGMVEQMVLMVVMVVVIVVNDERRKK